MATQSSVVSCGGATMTAQARCSVGNRGLGRETCGRRMNRNNLRGVWNRRGETGSKGERSGSGDSPV